MEETKPCTEIAKTVVDWLTSPSSTNYVRMLNVRKTLENVVDAHGEECPLACGLLCAFNEPAFDEKDKIQ